MHGVSGPLPVHQLICNVDMVDDILWATCCNHTSKSFQESSSEETGDASPHHVNHVIAFARLQHMNMFKNR